MTRQLEALVDHYLLEWGSNGWANAYHSLIELGPQILPLLEKRFAGSRDAAFRTALVELARQLHSEGASVLFETALDDEAPEVWKAALDGLVALASPASILLLANAMTRIPPDRTEVAEWKAWVAEALQQARAEFEARGGAA